jgi:hypothetical protein
LNILLLGENQILKNKMFDKEILKIFCQINDISWELTEEEIKKAQA